MACHLVQAYSWPFITEGLAVKPNVALFPFDAIPLGFDMVRLEHVELLLTQWWCRALRADLRLAIPNDWLLPICEVMTWACEDGKYPERDWEQNPERWQASRHFSAFMRHRHSEHSHDPESGLPSWTHAAARAVMLATLVQRGLLIDDRPPQSVVTAGQVAEFESELAQVAGMRDGGVN